MIRLKRRGGEAPGIMLGPMIDMMFLLLIFFIVSTMYMSEQRVIPVKLPAAQSAQTQSAAKFRVTIKQDGQYWLEDRPASEPELIAKAVDGQKRSKDFAVIIRADEAVPYKAVIHLLDALKKAGITRAGLAADKGGTP